MKINLCLYFILFLSVEFLQAQSLVYSVSGEFNNEKVALDSIIIENMSNTTRIVFDDLPVQDIYQIDLTAWKSTGISNFNASPGFIVEQNSPGLLIITNKNNSSTEAKLSIYNILGEKVYSSGRTILNLSHSIKIEIGLPGIYMVKADSPTGSQSFKMIGSVKSEEFDIEVIEKNISTRNVKNADIIFENDFSYLPGDSIQISVYKANYLSIPEGLRIVDSESINFNLYEQEFTDPRDNRVYQTVRIGNQIWLAENLAYLPFVNPSSDLSSTEAFNYVYNYEGTDVEEAKQTENFKKYGVLYNWVSAQNVSPEGWHLPTENEWQQLELNLGMSPEDVKSIGWRGTDEGSKLKSTTGWGVTGNGTNESGFSALPSGFLHYQGYEFYSIEIACYWWSSTEKDELTARGRGLEKEHDDIVTLGSYKTYGFSVRCVRD